MNRRLFATFSLAAFTAGAVVFACYGVDTAPTPVVGLTANDYISATGALISVGDAGVVPSTATGVLLILSVTASGMSPVSITTTGVLTQTRVSDGGALAAINSLVDASADASAASGALTIPLSLTATRGAGSVTVSVGETSRTWIYEIAPFTPAVGAVLQYVGSAGVPVDVAYGAIPSTAVGLNALLSLGSTAGGSTPVSVTTSGVLALAHGNDGGTFNATPPPDGGTVTILVPLTLTSTSGEGALTATAGGVSETWMFHVTPLSVPPSICTQSVAFDLCGGQATGAGLDATPDAAWQMTTVGGLPAFYSMLPSAGQTYRVGDRLVIAVTAPAKAWADVPPGAKVQGTLSTGGSIALAVDGGTVTTIGLTFTAPSTPRISHEVGAATTNVPAVVVAPGLATISASVGGGPVTTVERNTTPPTDAIYQVRFLEPKGTGAVDELVVCSTRTAGNLSMQSLSDAATVAPSTASLISSTICPPGYPASANFVWTGFESYANVAVTDSLSGAVTVETVPTLGTVANGSVSAVLGSPTWYCQEYDAGMDAGGVYPDGGVLNGGTDRCPGSAILSFSVTVTRTPPPGYAGDASMLAAVGAQVALKSLPPDVTVQGTIPPTGVSGVTTVKLLVPPGFPTLSFSITVDGLSAGSGTEPSPSH